VTAVYVLLVGMAILFAGAVVVPTLVIYAGRALTRGRRHDDTSGIPRARVVKR
jgi:hypothetical protein